MIKVKDIKGFDVVIDVVAAEYFAEEHITGAINICAYEMAFIEKIKKLYPDVNTKILVYGPGDAEGIYALDKLLHAGYIKSAYLEGGLDAWSDNGGSVEISKRYSLPKVGDGNYTIDREKSLVKWVGRNKGNSHHGTIDITQGEVFVVADGIKGSSFSLDMNSIKCIDLAGDPSYAYLLSHLKSADFFLTKKYPSATISIVSVSRISGRTQSECNYDVTAEMTMRGQTHEIEFEAAIHPTAEKGISVQAHFDFDRTDWGMVYGSERFLRHLGMHILQDNVTIDLQLYFVVKT